MHERYYYTYIVASRSLTLYIGMTGDLDKRIFEHKNKCFEGFSATYNCNRLIWFERYAHAGSRHCAGEAIKGVD